MSKLTYGQTPPQAHELAAISDPNVIARNLSLNKFKDKVFAHKIKIAILDNGFFGWEQEKGKNLPADTQYHAGPKIDADALPNTNPHGLFMARLVTLVMQKSQAKTDYELHLFNSFGYSKFADAVNTVIQDKFDIVLYSQVWEFGGNGDGKGFINVLVDKAVAAGVIWINAAGNFNQLTHVAPVDGKVEGNDEWVVFKDAHGKTSNGVKIICAVEKKDKCSLHLVLSWNSFKDDWQAGTDKDLDLFLFDSKGNLVGSSSRHQKLAGNTKDDPLASLIPREIIESNPAPSDKKDPNQTSDRQLGLLSPGIYNARVKISSKNFSASQDELRLTASGPGIAMLNPTPGETLLPPADNPGVIVAGANDDPHTGVSKKLNRPDVVFKSAVSLKDGHVAYASSNAAAFAAGLAALFIGTGTEKTHDAVLAALKTVTQKLEPVPIQPPQPKEQPKVGKPGNYPPPPTANTNPPAPGAKSPGATHAFNSTPPSQAPNMPNPQQQPGMAYRPGMPPMGPPGATPTVQPPPMPPTNCLQPAMLPVIYPQVRDLLFRGAAMGVLLPNGRFGIILAYAYPYPQLGPGDRLFMTPQGPLVIGPRQQQGILPVAFYEIISERVPVCENLGWAR